MNTPRRDHSDGRIRPPNVLWIMVDQMRADACGFTGNDLVATPNLDRLAERGSVFERAFTQCPLCTPARASVFTGRYMHAHGAWWNGMPMIGERPILPQLLRKHGYDTGIVGKLHLHPTDASHGFDHKELHEERLEDELNAYSTFLVNRGHPGETPRSFTDWDFRGCGICRMPEELEETRWVADRTDAFLKQRAESSDRETPFFLYSSFLRPHSPFNPLERFADMYDDAPIEAHPFSRSEWDRVPPRVRLHAEASRFSEFTQQQWALMRRRYLALCTQVDEPGELYDLVADPGERTNLFSNPANSRIIEDLKGSILDWMVRTSDLQTPAKGNSYFASYFEGQ